MSQIHQDSLMNGIGRRRCVNPCGKFILLSTAASFLPLFAALPAAAQDRPAQRQMATGFEEIVVQARRRDESLFEVPVAVTAMSSADIERYGSSSITKIAEMTPNVQLGRTAGASGAGITIRGIGTDGSNVGFDQAVAINIDGVQINRGRALWNSYFDLEQVEVLKGPQALFFGKNSPAGVVSLTSKSAGDELEAFVRVGYEFRADEVIGEGAISGPITDALGARLAVRARNMQGYMRNIAEPVANPAAVLDPSQPAIFPGARDHRLGERELAGRLSLDWDAGGPFTASLKVTGNMYEDDGAVYPMELVDCASGPNTVVTQSVLGRTLVDPVGECRPNWTIASSDIPKEIAAGYLNGRDGEQYTDMEAVVSSLTMNYDFGGLNLTSVTGYYVNDAEYLMNNDWSSFVTISATEAENYNQFTQELRFYSDWDTPINFMLGAFYQKSDLDFERSMNLDALPQDPATGRYQWVNHGAGIDGKAYSVFDQLTWDITDQIELAGGARWTREEKDSFVANTYANPFISAVFPVRRLDLEFQDEDISPEATITWRPTNELMLYAAYKTGYKSGGAGISALVNAVLTEEQVAYEPETAEGFEIGTKTELMDGRMRLSATAYRYVFSDLQVNAWDPNTNSYQTTNAAKARQYGIETEVNWLATDQLSIRGALSYNHSRYATFTTAPCYSGQTEAQGCIGGVLQDLTGRPTFNAPDWVAIAGFTYSQPVGGFMVELTGDAFYSDDYYFIPTQSPAAQQDSFVRFNSSIRIMPDNEGWELAVIGRNLTNKKVIVSGQDRPAGVGDTNGVVARPREVLLQVTTRF